MPLWSIHEHWDVFTNESSPKLCTNSKRFLGFRTSSKGPWGTRTRLAWEGGGQALMAEDSLDHWTDNQGACCLSGTWLQQRRRTFHSMTGLGYRQRPAMLVWSASLVGTVGRGKYPPDFVEHCKIIDLLSSFDHQLSYLSLCSEKDFLLSEIIVAGHPWWYMKRRRAWRKDSVDRLSTISRWMARTVAQVKRAPHALTDLFLPYWMGQRGLLPQLRTGEKRTRLFQEVSLPLEWCVAAGVACDKLHSLWRVSWQGFFHVQSKTFGGFHSRFFLGPHVKLYGEHLLWLAGRYGWLKTATWDASGHSPTVISLVDHLLWWWCHP